MLNAENSSFFQVKPGLLKKIIFFSPRCHIWRGRRIQGGEQGLWMHGQLQPFTPETPGFTIAQITTNSLPMKKYFTSLPGLLMLALVSIFASCSIFEADEIELSPVFDCPDLQLNFQDSCELTILGAPQAFFGIVDADCNCLGDSTGVSFDCPDLQLNAGDACITTDSTAGTLTPNCFCQENTTTFDCPDLMLNFRDSCIAADGNFAIVDENCLCEHGGSNTFDCPDLSLNIQDTCLVNGQLGLVTADCACDTGDPVTYDCEDLQANFRDVCFAYDPVTQDTISGFITENCECDAVVETFDCPDLQLNWWDACITADSTAGTLTPNCFCQENPTFDCPDLRLNFGDQCMKQDSTFGTITQDCLCL